ncbi:pentatricopeptide repeat-containing protein At4g14190, chloroplastic [Morus notabilis]|uniref:pentatricopeptide repeat-containing protein At4g14190, chloroplastic n=1 Tax=Morus notabilis TaxID=981085 RepID=UPI000CED23C4|nr:pentatricopeptide repeat-containing protein At4g14190, chloroplastic [Morus notabilis]
MESIRTLNHHSHTKTALRKSFTPVINGFLFPLTLTIPNKPKLFSSLRLSVGSSLSGQNSSTEHTTLLVETFHEHRKFKTLLKRLSKNDSCPMRLLREDGDWCKEHFWAVVRFLRHGSRTKEIVQVFDLWKNIEKSRINELNYCKIIKMLGEEGLMEEAVLSFEEMKSCGLSPTLEVYNSMIHGFSQKGDFDDALVYLNEMREQNVVPETDTYEGLIEAYAKYEMYDEIGLCLKKMKLNGCPPDHITYNLLMRKFSKGGLLKRMESVYHTMISKRMYLQSSTLVAMLETYARFGILDKMEKFYMRTLKTKTPLGEDLIRKLAEVYIDNYLFSRLETLGVDLSTTFGETDLLWCLRLLSHAFLFSRKGMDFVIQEMERAHIPWNVTFANIILLTHLKMKDFTHLRISLSQLTHSVEPDIVTVGILFDAIGMGFDGTRTLETWKRMDFFYKAVEMNTDPVVITAFGKGNFLQNCERAYSSLESEVRETKSWTYNNLVDLVFKHKGSDCQQESKPRYKKGIC